MAIEKTDLEFLQGLENLVVPEMLRHLQYREDNQTKNLYNEFCNLFEETILGEFSWIDFINDDQGKRIRKTITFVSYLKEEEIIKKDEFKNLKEFERQFGVRDTLLVRLEEAKVFAQLPEPISSKPVFVYSVRTNLINIIINSFMKYGMKLSEKQFTGLKRYDVFEGTSGVIKFTDIASVLNRNIEDVFYKEQVESLLNLIVDDVLVILGLEFKERQRVFSKWVYRPLVRQAVEKLIAYFCSVHAKKKHFFVWGYDLTCAICGSDKVYDDIHLQEVSVELGTSLPEKEIRDIFALDKEMFPDEDL